MSANWQNLPTDYTDATWEGLRKFSEVENADGTKSFVDVTQYTQKEKSFFGAKDANQMNEAINELMGTNKLTTLEEVDAVTAEGNLVDALAIKELSSSITNIDIRTNPETGKPEWRVRGADTFQNFNSGEEPTLLWTNPNPANEMSNYDITLAWSGYEYLLISTNASTTQQTQTSYLIPCDSSRKQMIGYNMTENSNRPTYREITFSSGKINVGNGYVVNGTSVSGSGKWIIPTRIWGVKSIPFNANAPQYPQQVYTADYVTSFSITPTFTGKALITASSFTNKANNSYKSISGVTNSELVHSDYSQSSGNIFGMWYADITENVPITIKCTIATCYFRIVVVKIND